MYTTSGTPLVLGRAPDCSLILATDGVSRRHAQVVYRGGQYWLQPHDTLNGTRVNGELVHQPRPLADGDQLGICDHAFVVFYGEPTDAQLQQILARPPTATPPPVPAGPPQPLPVIASAPTAVPAAGRSRAGRWVLGVLGLLALVAGVVVGTVKLMEQDDETAGAATEAPAPADPPAPTPTPTPAPAPAEVATPATPALAVVEPTDVTDLEVGSSGTVTATVEAGARVRRGDVVVSFRERSEAASKARIRLRDLQRKYGDAEEYADFIARARQEYARARRERPIIDVEAPIDGVVIEAPLSKGDSVRDGTVVARVARRARLLVSRTAIEGTGTTCTAEIAEPKLTLEGRLEGGDTGGKRALQLDELPAELTAGAVVEARLVCSP